jgi:hypothetical protein
MQENKHHKLIWLWIGVMLTLCCAQAQAQSRDRLPLLRTFNSARYTVHTSMNIRHVQPFAKHMDKVFNEYQRRFEKLKLTSRNTTGQLDLYLFETAEQYHAFLQSKGVNSTNSQGMFVVAPKINGLLTYIKDRSVRNTLATLQHEGFHQFAFMYLGQELPVWVNEGIAQFFEDGVIVDGRMHLNLPNSRKLDYVKNCIQTNRILPFGDLIGMTDDTWRQNTTTNPTAAAMQYNQSWSMVYFLINSNDKLLAAFNQYLIALAKGVDSQTAFLNAFSLKSNSYAQLTADFEKAWEKYTADIEPSTVSQVSDNMVFLAHGLMWIRKAKRPEPQSTQELRSVLQQVGYRVTRTVDGIQTHISAEDESLYRYQLPNGNVTFLNFTPSRSNEVPPTISAPGLKPSPTLAWYKMDGDLMYDITYK